MVQKERTPKNKDGSQWKKNLDSHHERGDMRNRVISIFGYIWKTIIRHKGIENGHRIQLNVIHNNHM